MKLQGKQGRGGEDRGREEGPEEGREGRRRKGLKAQVGAGAGVGRLWPVGAVLSL